MKSILKRINAHLATTPTTTADTTSETTTQRVFMLDMDKAAEAAMRHIRMQTIFPHPPVLQAGNSYSDWYARVADVWQRRRAVELETAPTDDLQRIISSVMTDRLATARTVGTTLH